MFKRGLGCARLESLGSSVKFVMRVIASIPKSSESLSKHILSKVQHTSLWPLLPSGVVFQV